MHTQTSDYPIMIIGLILVLLIALIYRKIPAKFDLLFVRTNRKRFKRALMFDEGLTFIRLRNHYKLFVMNEKIFKEEIKMKKFLDSASFSMIRSILKSEYPLAGLCLTLERAKDICEQFPELKPILINIGQDAQIQERLRLQLKKYRTSLNESFQKENPTKAQDIAIRNLNFFFSGLRMEDLCATNLYKLFSEEREKFKKDIEKIEKMNLQAASN